MFSLMDMSKLRRWEVNDLSSISVREPGVELRANSCDQLCLVSCPTTPQILSFSPLVRSHLPRCQEPVLGFHPRALKVFLWAMYKEKRKRKDGKKERQGKNHLPSNSPVSLCSLLEDLPPPRNLPWFNPLNSLLSFIQSTNCIKHHHVTLECEQHWSKDKQPEGRDWLTQV